MNKVFLAVFVFGFANCAAALSIENTAKPSQFEVNMEADLNLFDDLAKGKSKYCTVRP